MMNTSILARLAALKSALAPELKAQWRTLFGKEPPPYNRRFLESRLAYRIQELEQGGLSHATVSRLEAPGKQVDPARAKRGKRPTADLPLPGTRLIRLWHGTEHTVTVLADGFEWQGRPYKSLSAIARAITGTRWNGWAFFGLKSGRGSQ